MEREQWLRGGTWQGETREAWAGRPHQSRKPHDANGEASQPARRCGRNAEEQVKLARLLKSRDAMVSGESVGTARENPRDAAKLTILQVVLIKNVVERSRRKQSVTQL